MTPLAFSHKNLPQLMLLARERVLARFRPLLNRNGFTEQQWRIARALVEYGPLEPRQIVSLCSISSPSLAGILARMEELGYVQRQRFANDQRRVLVSPTRKSLRIAAEMAPAIEQLYAELERELGPAFTHRLYDSLAEVIEKLGPADKSAAGDRAVTTGEPQASGGRAGSAGRPEPNGKPGSNGRSGAAARPGRNGKSKPKTASRPGSKGKPGAPPRKSPSR